MHFAYRKTGWALFHISNRKNWEFPNPRDFRHAMDMKFATFLHEFKELSTSRGNRDRMGFRPGISHAGAPHANTRQIARGGRCLNNCAKGGKYALHSAVQNVLAKALNGKNLFYMTFQWWTFCVSCRFFECLMCKVLVVISLIFWYLNISSVLGIYP